MPQDASALYCVGKSTGGEAAGILKLEGRGSHTEELSAGSTAADVLEKDDENLRVQSVSAIKAARRCATYTFSAEPHIPLPSENSPGLLATLRELEPPIADQDSEAGVKF